MEKVSAEATPSHEAVALPEGFTEQEIAELTPEEQAVILPKDTQKDGTKGKEAQSKANEKGNEAPTNQPDPTTEQKHKVKVAGQEMEVPLKDLIAGYQKGVDYTQKSQKVAAVLKQIEDDPLGFLERNPVLGNKLLEQYRQRSAATSERPAFDPNDPEGSAKRIEEWAANKARAELLSKTQETSEAEQFKNQVQADVKSINDARQKEGLTALTPEEIQEIAAYGDEHGIASFQSAYKLKNYDAEVEKAKVAGAKSVIEQVKKGKGEEAKKLPAGGAGGGAPAALDISSLSSDQIDSMSDEQVNELLLKYGGSI